MNAMQAPLTPRPSPLRPPFSQAALSLARAPSVFHAAVAGAPVTSWDGYDTHYTERYMVRGERNTLRSGLAAKGRVEVVQLAKVPCLILGDWRPLRSERRAQPAVCRPRAQHSRSVAPALCTLPPTHPPTLPNPRGPPRTTRPGMQIAACSGASGRSRASSSSCTGASTRTCTGGTPPASWAPSRPRQSATTSCSFRRNGTCRGGSGSGCTWSVES